MRYIPLLSLAALLIACDPAANFQAPTFAKEGDEVTYEEFQTKGQETAEDSELNDDEFSLGDRGFKIATSRYTLTTKQRDNKEFYKAEETRSGKSEAQFDYANYVGKIVTETKETTKYVNQEGESSSSSNENTESYVQFGKVNGVNGLLRVNTKTKTYSLETAGSKSEKVFDNYVRSALSSCFYYFGGYLPNGNQDAGKYLFYVNNGKLFTYTTNQNDEYDDFDDYEYYNTRLRIKAQIDLTDKKQALRVSYEFSEEYKYKINTYNYLRGDVIKNERKEYVEFTTTVKDYNFDAVDISNYTTNTIYVLPEDYK